VPGMAPVPREDVIPIMVPPDAAAPGTMGVHRVYGTFALARRSSGGAGGLGVLSLNEKDVERWSGALKWMMT